MEVILIDDVKNLGIEGEVLEVADGYARNYLLPERLAVNATPANKQRFEKKQQQLTEKRERLEADARERAEQLRELTLTIEKNASEEGSLYGSVSQSEIAELLQDEGFEDLAAKQIIIDEAIKEVGEHRFRVNLAGSVDAEVTLEVVAA